MSSRNETTANLLFGVSVICTLLFGIFQIHALLHSTRGVNVTAFIPMMIFFGLNAWLINQGHLAAPSRVMSQTRFSYQLWVATMLAIVIVQLFRRPTWTQTDTVLTSLVVTGSILLGIWTAYRRLSINTPSGKALLAIVFKATPQFMLAVNLLTAGNGSGLSGVAVITGLTTMCIRLGQLVLAIREAGWEQNRVWSAISEVANAVSWSTVAIVWVIVKYQRI